MYSKLLSNRGLKFRIANKVFLHKKCNQNKNFPFLYFYKVLIIYNIYNILRMFVFLKFN